MAYRITEDCAACGTCLPECPVGAISEGDIYKIDPNACIDCGTCADACPMGAIVAGEYPDSTKNTSDSSIEGSDAFFMDSRQRLLLWSKRNLYKVILSKDSLEDVLYILRCY